jgi:hypothetical protein
VQENVLRVLERISAVLNRRFTRDCGFGIL